MVATLRMKNENYLFKELSKIYSSFFILHSSLFTFQYHQARFAVKFECKAFSIF